MAQQMAEAVVSWPKIHILKLNESCSGMKNLIFILINNKLLHHSTYESEREL